MRLWGVCWTLDLTLLRREYIVGLLSSYLFSKAQIRLKGLLWPVLVIGICYVGATKNCIISSNKCINSNKWWVITCQLLLDSNY